MAELLKRAAIALPLIATAAAAPPAPPICLSTIRIDHTDVPDDSTILFTMRDGSVYRNHLPSRCTGLSLDTRGFTYAPIPGSDEICSSLVTIRLNTTGAVCILGAFEKIKPARHAR